LLDEDMQYLWKNGEPTGERHCEDATRYLIMGLKAFLHREFSPPTKVEKKAKDWIEEHFQSLYDKIMNPGKKNPDWRDVF
jgi:hypothetical protein